MSLLFFFSSRRRHTRSKRDWSSDVCSSDLEHIRVFPLSNWTELDIWHYIAREGLEIPSIYSSHQREVFERDGILIADNEFVTRADDEPVFDARVRYRTVGDM